jgi:hypothetical protein
LAENSRVPELLLQLGSRIGLYPTESPLSLISDKHGTEFQALIAEMQSCGDTVDEDVINDMAIGLSSPHKHLLSIIDECPGFHQGIVTLYNNWFEKWKNSPDPSQLALLDGFYRESRLQHADEQKEVWDEFRKWYDSFLWYGESLRDLDEKGADCWILEAINTTFTFTKCCIKAFFINKYEEQNKDLPEYNACCFVGASLNSCYRCIYGWPFSYARRGQLLHLLRHMNECFLCEMRNKNSISRCSPKARSKRKKKKAFPELTYLQHLQHKTAVACVFQHLVFGTGANHYLLAF